jgi:Domain of unknown function (DUF3850)
MTQPPITSYSPREHFLKCWPQFMPRIASGQKTFEIRKNDRDYQVGDTLRLYEFTPNTTVQWDHSGRHPEIIADITYISSVYQQEGYIVLGIKVREPKP